MGQDEGARSAEGWPFILGDGTQLSFDPTAAFAAPVEVTSR